MASQTHLQIVFVFAIAGLLSIIVFLRNNCIDRPVTKLVDVMQAEEVQLFCYNKYRNCSRKEIKNTNVNFGTVPGQYDWRAKNVIGPVLQQKLCYGCWAFAIVGLMETMAKIHKISYDTLSIQQLIDCSTYNNGCIGGDVPKAMDFLCYKQFGITNEDNYPLLLIKETCHSVPDINLRRIAQFETICDMDPDDVIKKIYEHGPVVVIVNPAPLINYVSGVIQRSCYRSHTGGFIDHVVQIVGYNKEADIPYYIVKNSWGEDFGEKGYLRIAIGGDVCGITDEVTFFDVY